MIYLFIPARFTEKENAWNIYLKNNLNESVAAKYVKLSKGQDTASERVIVSFVVSEDGNISNIRVQNKDEVNSKLAGEAIRVIREFPRWIPATIYGEKVKFTVNQPIVFAVTR
jgi:TonB family protein